MITPVLTVRDAESAVAFYQRAFGAEEVYRNTYPNGQSPAGRTASGSPNGDAGRLQAGRGRRVALPLPPWCGRDEFEPRSAGEHAVMRRQRQPKPDRGGGDPPVTVVDLVTQRMPDLPASLT